MKQNVIAIDGPAGAGKSTVAGKVAETLGFVYIDTGAMYRAVAARVLAKGLELTDLNRITELAKKVSIRFTREHGALRVWADGVDVTAKIRTPEVTAAVAQVSQVVAVRAAMIRLQREMAEEGRVVLDGRDIGTVVLPEACAKIFLTASAAERAKRRWQEMKQKGYELDLSALQQELEERDRQDSERELSPLVQAEDAVLIDTTAISIDAVVDRIIRIYREQRNNV